MFESVLLRPLSHLTGEGRRTRVAKCHAKDPPHPPPHNWYFAGIGNAYDVRAIRRGWTVYKSVCATCHSLNHLAYAQLKDTVFPENKVRAIAAENTKLDFPDQQGELKEVPVDILDNVGGPYPNSEAAAYANGGAIPPDLTYITRTRHGAGDYLFALMIGYRDPPVGVEMRAGLYYNIYFPGGAIGMPPPLSDGAVEFEDGTPACVSQMASDLVHFFVWSGRPKWEKEKLNFFKFMCFGVGILGWFYWWRTTAAHMKSIRYDFVTPKL